MGSRLGWFFGKLISIAAIVSSALLMVNVYTSKMFPEKYMMAAGIALLIMLLLVTILTWNSNGKGRYVFGFLLGIIITAASILGTKYLTRTVDTAKEITTTAGTELASVGVYVKEDNKDDFEEAASGYQFAIVKEIDRENTDHAVQQLKDTYGPEKDIAEYDSLPQLVQALKDGDADAILMNTAFVGVLEDMEDFEKIGSEIKLVKTLDVEVEKSEEETKEEQPDAINAGYSGNAFTMYISGIDTRSSRIESRSRSDVNILATINPDTHQILLVSTPRDYYVELSNVEGAMDKLTHAGIYGIQVSSATLGKIYGVNTDYYFRVNFVGFENIIDALGGVTVHSDYDFSSSSKAGGYYHFNQGDNNLNGAAALAFCRERSAFKSGDHQRGRNQMEVVRAVIRKMMSVDMLTNYSKVLEAMEGSFETSMPYDKMSELVRGQLESGAQWNIVSYSVTGSGSSAVPYSMSQRAYVMIPDENSVNTAKAMIRQIYEDKEISELEASTETETDGALTFESETESKAEPETKKSN